LSKCFFVSDLHGNLDRYQKLFKVITSGRPNAVFIGGDILPSEHILRKSIQVYHQDFINNFLVLEFKKLRKLLGKYYPRIFLIMGNDDARFEEPGILAAASENLWEYVHNRKIPFSYFQVYGYAYVPPTPFMLKDWERYDVSRFVDHGSISPEEGYYSVPVSENEKKYSTIQGDLEKLTNQCNMKNAIFLFHCPPYKSKLDRASLDGKMINHVPIDVHVGSIAIKKFIKNRQPLITLHGHIHESARLTGNWKEKFGRTNSFSAAHDGPELSLVQFDPENPEKAERELI